MLSVPVAAVTGIAVAVLVVAVTAAGYSHLRISRADPAAALRDTI